MSDFELRQYNCPHCTDRRPFWKNVEVTDGDSDDDVYIPTETCLGCYQELDPIPVEEEKGYGEFKCSRCDHEWTSPKAEWNVTQPCHECGKEVRPDSLGPGRMRQRRSNRRHRCENCPDCNQWPVSRVANYD